jgi:hypothetical protein
MVTDVYVNTQTILCHLTHKGRGTWSMCTLLYFNLVHKSIHVCITLNANCIKHYTVDPSYHVNLKKWSYLYNRPCRPTGLWNIKDTTVSKQSGQRWRLGCQHYTPAELHSAGRVLALISVSGWVSPGPWLWRERLGKLKKFNIYNWTCNVLACNMAPQPCTVTHGSSDMPQF